MDLLPFEIKRFIGRKYGKLTIIKYEREKYESYHRRIYHQYYYRCRCDCGNEKVARLSDILSGRVTSCGCYRREVMNYYGKTTNLRHGCHGTRLYNIWVKMKARCNNPNDPAYMNYGGRGISVCDDWNSSFILFRRWAMESGYDSTLTIERNDVNGNYCPENCRWIPSADQMRNTRRSVYITYIEDFSDIGRGKIYHTYTMSDWARILGTDRRRISDMLKKRGNRTVNEILEHFMKNHVGFIVSDNMSPFPEKFEESIHD